MSIEPSYIPKDILPYPVGRQVAGRIVRRISATLYKIDLSGRHYTAEVSTEKHPAPFSAGDAVMVRVVEKLGNKAVLEIVDPDFPDVTTPGAADIEKLARSAGWPADAAALALVSALVERRLPLRSAEADGVYRKLKAMDNPTKEDAAEFLK